MEYIDKFLYELIALFVALVVSWLVTEPVKRFLRNKADLQNASIPRIISFCLAMIITWVMWPEKSTFEWWPLGLVVGLGSPIFYRIFIAVLEKRNPDLAIVITGKKS